VWQNRSIARKHRVCLAHLAHIVASRRHAPDCGEFFLERDLNQATGPADQATGRKRYCRVHGEPMSAIPAPKRNLSSPKPGLEV
jgi:hypothetical protein